MRERGRDQRRAKRTRRRNAAWIGLGHGGPRVPCVLWDISETGARLAAPRTNALPGTFSLLLTRDGNAQRLCRVVWRNDRQLGVKFIAGTAANLDDEVRSRQPNVAVTASSGDPAAAAALLLPGYGSHFLEQPARHGLPISSFAASMLFALPAAAVLFFVAGMQFALDAPWAIQLCNSTGNLCRHPEWTGMAAGLMAVIYLAVRGMEH